MIVPVFISHQGCPYRCAFCNQTDITGSHGKADEISLNEALQTYIGTTPADELPPHREVAFYGGSFTGLPFPRQEYLLGLVQTWIRDGLVTSVRLSTHSLFIDVERLALLRQYHVKTIELGIQSTDAGVLDLSGRPCSMEVMDRAVSLIRKNGFRLGLQLMPGLPRDDENTWQKSVEDTLRWEPDFVRLYPTLVVRHTKLHQMYRAGLFTPWPLDFTVKHLAAATEKFRKKGIPVIRIGLHPDKALLENYVDGPFHPAMRYLVDCRIGREHMIEKIQGIGETCGSVTFRVPKKLISIYIGHKRENIYEVKRVFGLKALTLRPDEDCERLELVA